VTQQQNKKRYRYMIAVALVAVRKRDNDVDVQFCPLIFASEVQELNGATLKELALREFPPEQGYHRHYWQQVTATDYVATQFVAAKLAEYLDVA
jgi:hypothetical protein